MLLTAASLADALALPNLCGQETLGSWPMSATLFWGYRASMARYVTSVRTPMSVDEAFAYMADLRNFANWDPGVSRSVLVAGDAPGPDAAFDVTVKGPGRDMVLRYAIVEWQPTQEFVAKAETSTLVSNDRITVAEVDGATIVTYDAELNLKGVFKIGALGLKLVFNRIGDRAAAGLRTALRGQAVTNP